MSAEASAGGSIFRALPLHRRAGESGCRRYRGIWGPGLQNHSGAVLCALCTCCGKLRTMDGAWLFRGLPEAAVMPRRCACCGAEPSRGMRERRPLSTFAVLVPYCAECHRHASMESTRVLAVSVAAALASVTLTVGLPLV